MIFCSVHTALGHFEGFEDKLYFSFAWPLKCNDKMTSNLVIQGRGLGCIAIMLFVFGFF